MYFSVGFLKYYFQGWIFTKFRCYSSNLATELKLSFLFETRLGDMCPDDLNPLTSGTVFFLTSLHLACCRKRYMAKAPKVPGNEIQNKESRDICDPTVEGHDMLPVPPNQSTCKGKTESHRSTSHVSCPILFFFDLEIL